MRTLLLVACVAWAHCAHLRGAAAPMDLEAELKQSTQKRRIFFPGAHFTIPSFTMHAASGGFKENLAQKGQKQAGFGGTFGGALLTSGSFTHMAASGGFKEDLAKKQPMDLEAELKQSTQKQGNSAKQRVF